MTQYHTTIDDKNGEEVVDLTIDYYTPNFISFGIEYIQEERQDESAWVNLNTSELEDLYNMIGKVLNK